jgi:peptidyl-prolyl cis-trans isomerase A (cyclophilin A)
MRVLVSLLLSGAALLAQTPATKTGAAPKTGATKAPAANPLLNPAGLTRVAPATYKVKFATTAGDFTVEVHRDWSPLGADRFYNLVRNKFFNGETFFRVVPNFIVQFGLNGDPKVNHAWENAKIKDDPVKQHNTRGTVVFATAGPGTRTTQLFINLRDNTGSLDPQGFSPFGTVTEGMENVDKIYAAYGERPDQGGITDQGDAYINKNFPSLTRISSTTLILPEGTAAPAAPKKAAPATKTGTTPTAPAKKQ